mmetsp:Transcript_7138/g.10631  ORF Transcript_7138/g.10631 Transcript_7138/m.10631 type:complete len:634 (-) Transcript_7138:208-2109(-)
MSDAYFFELFDAALAFHSSNLSLNSLTKSPNKTILLKELATLKGEFNEALYKFICFVISDNGRELLVSRQCKLRFQHIKSDISLTKVLIYADSRCRLQETHSDWVAKCIKFWNKKENKSNPQDAEKAVTFNSQDGSKNFQQSVLTEAALASRSKSPSRGEKPTHRKTMSLSKISPETFDGTSDNISSPPSHKVSLSLSGMELRQLRGAIGDSLLDECDSPVSCTTALSYSKTYAKETDSPMKVSSGMMISGAAVGSKQQKRNVAMLESNPLFVDPKRVLSQLEEERKNGQDKEMEISQLKINFDAILVEKDGKIENLSSELEAKNAKLAQATSAARIAANEKLTAERALLDLKERNEKLAAAAEKEFSSKKKELMLKASQYKRMKNPVVVAKDSTLEGLNALKSKLYTDLNLMSAFPFHSDNFSAANAELKSSVKLQITFPPDVVNKATNYGVNNGNRLAASAVETAPTVKINSTVIDGANKENSEVFYTLIMSDLDHISTNQNQNNNQNKIGSDVVIGEYMQWAVFNIPGDRFNEGTTLLEYIGPAPEHASGLHRIVFSLYKQHSPLSKPVLDEAKRYFTIRNQSSHSWMKNHAESIPVALNAFTVEWDQNVDYFHSLRGYVPPPAFRSPVC